MIVLYGVLLSMIITFFVFLSVIGNDYLRAYKIYYLLFTKKVFCNYHTGKMSNKKVLTKEFYFFDNKYLFVKIGNSSIYRYYFKGAFTKFDELTFGCPYLTFLNFILSKKFKKLEKKRIESMDELTSNMKIAAKKENRQNRLKSILK